MKKLLLSFLISTSAFANPCDLKREEITKEIQFAKEHKNNKKVSGLERALSELNANCTPEKLAEEKNKKTSG